MAVGVLGLIALMAGAAHAATSVTAGPCKDASGWVKVTCVDDTGAAIKSACTYPCGNNTYQKSTSNSSNGTAFITAPPPVAGCDGGNPVVDIYINKVKQPESGTSYNSLPNC